MEVKFQLSLPRAIKVGTPYTKAKHLNLVVANSESMKSNQKFHEIGKSPFFYGKINYKWPCSVAFCMFTNCHGIRVKSWNFAFAPHETPPF